MQTQQWLINVNGMNYQVEFRPSQWSGNHQLFVNGQQIPLQKVFFQAFVGMDQAVNIGGKECRLVMLGSKADLAVDGVYIGSQKPYAPRKGMPWWSWIFVAACVAIPIVSLGGALPMVLGVLGALGCVRTAISPSMKMPAKLLSCVGITALCWCALGILFLVMAQ